MIGSVSGFTIDVHPQESEDLQFTAGFKVTQLTLWLQQCAYLWLKTVLL